MRVPIGYRLRRSAGRYLPFLRVPPPPNREEAFRLRPLRNPAIEYETNEANEALLKVPRRKDRVGRVMAFLVHIPETRGVQLDEVGTFVWNRCDGQKTVETIVRETAKEYRMNRREVEVSVTTYLQMLAERSFIVFVRKTGGAK